MVLMLKCCSAFPRESVFASPILETPKDPSPSGDTVAPRWLSGPPALIPTAVVQVPSSFSTPGRANHDAWTHGPPPADGAPHLGFPLTKGLLRALCCGSAPCSWAPSLVQKRKVLMVHSDEARRHAYLGLQVLCTPAVAGSTEGNQMRLPIGGSLEPEF